MAGSTKQPTDLLVEPLTRREQDILALLEKRLTNPEIARELTLALSSVKWYIQQINHKLGVNSRRQAVARARELGLLEDFPTPKHNLPRQLTRFIGREKEIAQVKGLLEAHALVTLTGSGGVGKTRLAIRVAQEILEKYPDGVWLVDLAPLSDPGLLAQRLAAALGLREEAHRPIQETLVDFLRGKGALIVLDNCEHLSAACASLVDALLQACPRVKLLATSREILGVSGERPHRVPSLEFPDPYELPDLIVLQKYEAVRLFSERAQAALPGFQATAYNRLAIAQICQRLDGIPLALELAAARLNVLTTGQLAARLDDAFGLLTGGSRTALPRHQTLRATIDWSYQLLSESERILLRRLSIFAGGWRLEAAEAVASDPLSVNSSRASAKNEQPIPEHQALVTANILELLSSLVKKSMVIAERRQGAETRYRLLETVRQFALEKLIAAGESEALSDRHCQYFVQFAETGGPKMWSAERLEWTDRLNADLDNLRAAIQWSYNDQRNITAGLRIAAAIGRRFMQTMGLIEEARQWLLNGLRDWDPSSDRLLQARALNVLGWLDLNFTVSTDTLQRYEESVRLCRSIGPAANAELSWALWGLGWGLLILRGDEELVTARTLVEESIAVARQLGPADQWYLAFALDITVDLGRTKDDEQTRRHAEEVIHLHLQRGDRWSSAGAMWNLADVAEFQGDFEQARRYLEQSLALLQEAKDKAGVALTYRQLGRLFRHQGEYPTAISYHQEYLRAWNAMGGRARVGDGLLILGVDRVFHGCSLSSAEKASILWQAAKLLGAAEKLSGNERVLDTTPADVEDYHRALGLLHGQLDPAVFEKAWAEGQAMTLEETVNFALSITSEEAVAEAPGSVNPADRKEHR